MLLFYLKRQINITSQLQAVFCLCTLIIRLVSKDITSHVGSVVSLYFSNTFPVCFLYFLGMLSWQRSRGRRGVEMRSRECCISCVLSTWTRISSNSDVPSCLSKHLNRYESQFLLTFRKQNKANPFMQFGSICVTNYPKCNQSRCFVFLFCVFSVVSYENHTTFLKPW